MEDLLPLQLNLDVSNVFQKTWNIKNYRIIAHQGGSRSSKTYSICQYLIVRALTGENYTCTIARASYTWLKTSAMADFFEIIKLLGLYNEKAHNKTSHTYDLNGSHFSFVGLDESQKLRGRKQDVFWLNEANECRLDDFRQASLRTSGQIIIDYNPSARHHWIYDHILTRSDCFLLQSTYTDNPFLAEELKREIESLKDTDIEYWNVFGLGLRGASPELVFPNYNLFSQLPQGTKTAWGLDFGYNHPMALIQADYIDGNLYLTELIYQSFITLPELISKTKTLLAERKIDIWADSARPDYIHELLTAGLPIKQATKNVLQGIDRMKRSRIYINKQSTNLIKELDNYHWKKDAAGKLQDEPVKELDDAIDAARYAAYHLVGKRSKAIRVSIPGLR